MLNRPSIFLADDHSDFCEAAIEPLRGAFDVLGSAHDTHTAAADVARTKPDLVVIDVCMRLIDAIDAAQLIGEQAPTTRLLFVARSVDSALRSAPLSLGPLGFLVRISDLAELPSAIWSVLSDGEWNDKDEAQSINLTRREREVVQLLAEGKLMKQVADMLNVSPRTVAFHKYGVMRKRGLRSSAELVRLAVSEGLVA